MLSMPTSVEKSVHRQQYFCPMATRPNKVEQPLDLMSRSYTCEGALSSGLPAMTSLSSHRSYHTLPRKSTSNCTMTMSSTSFGTSTSTDSLPLTDSYVFNEVHPKYTNMMNDNHLINSCTEAQRDLRFPLTLSAERNYNFAAQNQNHIQPAAGVPIAMKVMTLADTVFNAQKLHQWISYMTKYVEAVSPRRVEVLRMSSFERKTRLREQVDLRKYIASYDARVKRFVRSATCASEGGINVKSIEERYLLLLLQAIDAQCLLEGYPGMRNSSNATTDETNTVTTATNSLATRFVEGQCSTPPYNYYCLNEATESEEKFSEYSYDSVDGMPPANLRDELLSVIGHEQTSSSSGQSRISVDFPSVDSDECKNDILNDLVKYIQSVNVQSDKSTTQRKVNRWLHFQPKKAISPAASPPHTTIVQDSMKTSPALDSFSSCSDATSGGVDQHWDHYQEMYSHVSSMDTSAAEKLLQFGDDYSDLLHSDEAATSMNSKSTSSMSLNSSSFNEHCLDENFLLSGVKKSLPLSALKTIDDIFNFKELSSISDDDLEWIQPGAAADCQSPRCSPSGTSGSQSSSGQSVTKSPVSDSYLDSKEGCETPSECSWLRSASSLSTNSFNSNEITIMPNSKLAGQQTTTSDARNSSDATTVSSDPEILSCKTKKKSVKPQPRIYRKLRRRKVPPQKNTIIDNPSASISQLVKQHLKDLMPDEVQIILNACQTHLNCLNHVLLGHTVNTIVQQPAMSSLCGKCDECHCGVIAKFVQSIVDFLVDYTNCFRHFTLYNVVLGIMKRLYLMVRYVSVAVRNHRLRNSSWECIA